MKQPERTRRIRRTPGTMSAAQKAIKALVGERYSIRDKIVHQLDAMAAQGPLTKEEVWDLTRQLLRENRLRKQIAADEEFKVEEGSGDVFGDVAAPAPRWGVIVSYIDGSGAGFPIEELSELASIVADGPDYKLIETIEIKMLNRPLIGEYKKTE